MNSGSEGAAVVAVDLGAASGRVMLGRAGRDVLTLTEVHRFPNGGVPVPTGAAASESTALHWDALRLWREVLTGLSAAGRRARDEGTDVVGVGVDTWAIDYGLLSSDGTLLGNPRSYRDSRTDGVADHALSAGGRDAAWLYDRTGLQHLPFTTIWQLVAEAGGPLLERARTLLLLPDLLGYWLSGYRGAEATNVSTTGLADVVTGDWAPDLLDFAGVPRSLLAQVHPPGQVLADLRRDIRERTGLTAQLTSVGSHDTASAVVAVPAADERFAYIACGTWGLVGVELESPVLTTASRQANFTNERGVDGRTRYLRNTMGLWVLQGCLAEWDESENGSDARDLDTLLAMASQRPAGGPVVDIDDQAFIPPGPMVTRVREACERAGVPSPRTPDAVVRCVLDSLALAFARAVDDAMRLSGRDVDVVHLVGGGARNALLCQLSADACGRPVLAGPVEATALGNVLVQARAHGQVTGPLEDLRNLVRRTYDVVRYDPT